MKTQLSDLEVVGYADVLIRETIPRIVPPVFRFKTSGLALVPPFTIEGDFVEDGVTCHETELADMAYQRKITLFETSYPAQAGHELWVDLDMNPQYDPIEDAHRQLHAMAETLNERAKTQLRANHLDDANLLVGQALAANEGLVESWAVLTAIHRIRGQENKARLVTRFAMAHAEAASFEQLVSRFVAEGTPKKCSKMKDLGQPRKELMARYYPNNKAA